MTTTPLDETYPLWHPFTSMKSFAQQPLVIEGGDGVLVYDMEGREYIDAAGGLWNLSLGLGHRRVLDATIAQLKQLAFAPLFGRANRPALDLARKLVALTPTSLKRVFVTNSGSEAVEVAIKAVRGHFGLTGQREKQKIVALRRSYHGSYCGCGTLSDNIPGKENFGSELPGILHIEPPYCYRCPWGLSHPKCGTRCADELSAVCDREEGSIAAFVMEPILGSGGIIVPPSDYHHRVRAICRKREIFLLLDEVATGFGRVGRMFAADHFGLDPDAMMLSKGINGGYLPLGATLFSDAIFEPFLEQDVPLPFGSTQNGNPVCCAAALAAIEAVEGEDLLQNCVKMGRRLKDGCLEMMESSRHIGDVRGVGLMVGVELVMDKEQKTPMAPQLLSFLTGSLRDNGLLVYPSTCGFSMFPSLAITEVEVDRILSILGELLIPISLGVRSSLPAAPGH